MIGKQKKWWQLKRMDRRDYGRVAILALVLAGIKGAIQIQLPVIVEMLSDILITVGIVSGIIWIFKPKNVQHNS